MDIDLPYKLALSEIQGIGAATFKQLLNYEGEAKRIFGRTHGQLQKIPGIGPKTAQLIRQISEPKGRGERILENIQSVDGRILYCKDKDYPQSLLNCPDAPAFLYVDGNVDLNHPKAISIVGTRKATNYGLKMVREFLEQWKTHSPLIISGLAYGIDIQAHKVAMELGLPTLAIMASGLDRIYPGEHISIAAKMKENGGLMTEYPPNTPPEGPRFPARNRLIAGMSEATIVIEAAERGGALITAEMAIGYHREVFALPGRLTDHFSEGCNNLIRSQKAIPLVKPEDLEVNLNWDQLKRESKKKNDIKNILESLDLSDGEKEILQLLSKNDFMQVEDLSWESEISIPQLATILLELELKSLIKNFPGNRYSLAS